MKLIRKYDVITNITADPIVPYRRAISGLLEEKILTVIIPNNEHIKPKEAKAKGMNCSID
tara:strand:+ start:415 stop:594 length:180 start_codon:yes stop_codon:yes gene_type:complete